MRFPMHWLKKQMNESELILTELLGCSRHDLYIDKNLGLNGKQSKLLIRTLKRRFLGEPIQYILGKTEFMGLEFRVSGEVFIPRADTEILVETALEIGNRLQAAGCRLKILDMGTGSGCIAISLAKLLPKAEIFAIDISGEALEIARQNASLHNVDITFLQSDLFSKLNVRTIDFDMIVSNPPYISTEEISQLQPEVAYEPLIALDGDRDGLSFYRSIIKDSQAYIKRGGFLALEMGFNQSQAISRLFTASGKFEVIEVIKDYNSIERVIVAKYG